MTRDGTAEPVLQAQILRREREHGKTHVPCSADHEQDWQPYPVDTYSATSGDQTYSFDPTWLVYSRVDSDLPVQSTVPNNGTLKS